MRTLREAWPETARQKSIQTRKNLAALKKTTVYLQTATAGAAAPAFSPRTGFQQPTAPDESAKQDEEK